MYPFALPAGIDYDHSQNSFPCNHNLQAATRPIYHCMNSAISLGSSASVLYVRCMWQRPFVEVENNQLSGENWMLSTTPALLHAMESQEFSSRIKIPLFLESLKNARTPMLTASQSRVRNVCCGPTGIILIVVKRDTITRVQFKCLAECLMGLGLLLHLRYEQLSSRNENNCWAAGAQVRLISLNRSIRSSVLTRRAASLGSGKLRR